jgi:hypothetical protein
MSAIQVDGYREFQRDLKAAEGRLPKALGEAHKNIGRFVISHLDPSPNPAAVGAGAGAAVRASATKREVIMRVGGKHRAEHSPKQQWGKKQVDPFHQPRSARPFIQKTATDREKEVLDLFENELMKALGPAFASSIGRLF